MKSTHEIRELIESAVTALGFELADFQVQYLSRDKQFFRVFIDKPEGMVSVGDCSAATRQIKAVLNVENFTANYALEVSSPGLDRPLTKLEHYARFIGKKVKLRLREPIGDRKNFTGILVAVEKDVITLTLADSDTPLKLLFNQVEKANLEPEWGDSRQIR